MSGERPSRCGGKRRFVTSRVTSTSPGNKIVLVSARRITPSFEALKPSSVRASTAARASSSKKDTRCEVALGQALGKLGIRYRVAAEELPGKPDLVFGTKRVAVFCDGDFWHGRNLAQRLAKLERGHNAPYWVAKITRNVERDLEKEAALVQAGWTVLRFWETDILRDAQSCALRVAEAIGHWRGSDRRKYKGTVPPTLPAPAQNGSVTTQRFAIVLSKSQLPTVAALQAPILRAFELFQGTASNEQLASEVARELALTEDQLAVVHGATRTGRTEFQYRMAWARTKLKSEGRIESAGHKLWRLREPPFAVK